MGTTSDRQRDGRFENIEFIVAFVIPDRKESKELLEKYLIYYGWAAGEKPAINVIL